MGSVHSQLVGDELHIARTFVSTGNPNGVVTPTIIGEFYWDSTNNLLYVAESLLNTSWVSSSNEFDEFIELTDTPNSYSGQAGLFPRVNQAENALEFDTAVTPDSHSQLSGDQLHIARTFVSGGDPNGVVTPGIIGEFYWDSTNNLLYVAEGLTNTDWVLGSTEAFDEFIELLDTPSTYSGQAGLSLQVTLAEDGIEFGQALDTINSPSFANLTLQQIFGDPVFQINNSSSVPKLTIKFDASADDVVIQSEVDLLINASGDISLNGDDIFVDTSTGFIGFNSTNPLAQFFLSSSENDTVPVSMMESLGTNGARITTLVGTRDPEGLITGAAGDHYWRVNGLDSDLFIKRSTSSNTTGWDSVFDGAGGVTTPGTLTDNFLVRGDGAQTVDIGNIFMSPDGNDLTIPGALDVIPSSGVVLSTLIDSVNLDGADKVFVVDNYAYVNSSTGSSIAIIDVSDPNVPFVVGSLIDAVNLQVPIDIFVSGKYAYLALFGLDSIAIVDVSDVSAPTFVARTISDATNMGTPQALYVAGKYAYVVSSTSGSLAIIDISDPNNPILVGSISTTNLTDVGRIFVLGKFAYVVTSISNRLTIVDVSDPAAPVEVGSVLDAVNLNGPVDIYVVGRYAYIVSSTGDSFSIFDISDPTTPTFVSSIIDSVLLDTVETVIISGNYAYTVRRNTTIVLIDITDRTNPVILNSFATGLGTFGSPIYISGKYAYLTDSVADAFGIIDLGGFDVATGNIGNLSAGNISVNNDIQVAGVLHSSGLNVGLQGIHANGDISNKGSLTTIPSNGFTVSTLIDNVNLNGAQDVIVVGNYAFVTSTIGDSLTIIDVSDPKAPFIVGILVDAINFNAPVSLFISGKYAYIGSNNSDSLSVIDISDVANPILVGTLVDAVTLSNVAHIYVAAKFVYVAGGSFTVVDISDPASPFVVGNLTDGSFGLASGIYILGKYAYVTTNSNRLFVIDISDPTSPFITGSVSSGTILILPTDVYVVGRYAYVVSDIADSFAIIDISDPTTPVIVSSIIDSVVLDRPQIVKISGNYAYVNRLVGNIVIIDITDRLNPVIINAFPTGIGQDFYISGKYGYSTSQNLDIFGIIDLGGFDVAVANIGNLSAGNLSLNNDAQIKGSLTTGGLNVGFHGIHSDGGISASGDFKIVPSVPMLLGSLQDSTNMDAPRNLYIVNNYAYVISAGISDSISILDITEPTSPVLVGVLLDTSNLGGPSHIIVAGKYAYISSVTNDSLVIVDVSDVSNPTFVSSLVDSATLDSAASVYVAGKYCYVLGRNSNSLAVIDISDPNDPVLAGSLIDALNFSIPEEMYVLGKFAYVTLGSSRLKIVDISDPIVPVIVGDLNLVGITNSPTDIYVVGRYAYILGRATDSLAIIDVSDPTTPALVGSVFSSILDAPESLSIDGNYAYVTTGGSAESIVVIDISGPTAPVITHSFPAGLGDLSAIHVSGKFAYILSSATDRFAVIDLNGIEAPTASIGNVNAGYLSVDNEAVIKGDLYAGGLNAGPHGIHSDGDISGLTSFSTFPNGDTFPIGRIKNTGSNPGVSNKFVGNRTPNGNVTGAGGDTYIRGNGGLSGEYESKELTTGTTWFKRSSKPPSIVEINTNEDFEVLASGGIIFVPLGTNLTLVFNITVITATQFVLTGGALNLTGLNQAGVGLVYVGGGALFTGGGSLFISGAITISSGSTGVLLNLSAPGGFLNINLATLAGWTSLGQFDNGIFLLRFLTLLSITTGFSLTNNTTISVFNIAHFGVPMAGPLLTIDTNNPLSAATFTAILNTTTATGSVFDFNTRINFDVPIFSITNCVALGGNIFEQTTIPLAIINSVGGSTPAAGTITEMADNFQGGTTVSCITNYFTDETLTITGTTNYNGTFQIFNVIPGVSFDIIKPFSGDDATGLANVQRLIFNLASGHSILAGDSIKVLGTNFYNAFYTVLEVVSDFVTVSGSFKSTNSGTIEINLSLDETDTRINATDNVGISSSIILASAFVNDNSTPVGAIVNNTFTDLVFGITGNALIASTTMAKWRMVDEINGTFESIADAKFDGWITFDFTVESSGGTVDFRFKFQIDRGSGFVDLPDPVEVLVAVGSDAQSVTKTFAVQAFRGDLIKPLITRNSGSSGITMTYATINTRE